ncbi:hypothetical protein ElyMa_002775900 [Elysia marginata]|uniref:Protein aurora borealis n=1 Tax=Elysia marginata TaxID=1093978 RepID=A0AAV4HQ78_9GAST|nr:hypothetical protein ElyMa_002775900 [Elysia marginata]
MKVAAPWMTTSAVVVDTLPLDDPLDNKMGRTDVIVKYRVKRLVEIRSWMAKARESLEFPRPFLPGTSTRASRSVSDIHMRPSQLDLKVCESLKALWTDSHDQSQRQDSRSTIQLKKSFRSLPPTFAIKGAGQTEMPTDTINAVAGCPHWSDLVPEGERRVLEHPHRVNGSLWNLSMKLARQSLQPPGKLKQTVISDKGPSPQVITTATQASGDGSTIDNEQEGLSSNCRCAVENDSILKTSVTEDVGDRNHTHHEAEKKTQLNKEFSKKKEPLDDEQERVYPSLVLCEFDDNFDAEGRDSPKLNNVLNIDVHTAEFTPKEEVAKQDQIVNDSEFFNNLEITYSEEALAAAESKPKPNTSEIFIGDSGLSSFGPDANISRSSNECTANDESEAISLFEDPSSEHQKHGLTIDTENWCWCPNEEKEDNANSCSLSNPHFGDEGFAEPSHVSAFMHAWGETPTGPFPEDESEIPEQYSSTPAYWQRLHHSRQMSLPLLAVCQQESQPTGSDYQMLKRHPEQQSPPASPASSASEIHEQMRNIKTGQAIPSVIEGFPLASTAERTLGYLFEQHCSSSHWQCWTRGESFELCEDQSLEEKLYDDTSVSVDHSTPCAADANVPASLSTHLSKDDIETMLRDTNPNDQLLPLGDQSSSECSEVSGDTPTYDSQTTKNCPESVLSLSSESIAHLRDVSFEDLSVSERRFVAQALELEWGCSSFKEHGKENNSPDSSSSDQNGKENSSRDSSSFHEDNKGNNLPDRTSSNQDGNENSSQGRRSMPKRERPDQTPIRTSFLQPPRRTYQETRHSLSDLRGIVERGSLSVDRRAAARQAEMMWGQAASSVRRR